MVTMSDPDPKMWPFEVEIDHESGSREYHQHARDNQDGTVTVCELHLPEGYVERTYPGRTEPRFCVATLGESREMVRTVRAGLWQSRTKRA